MKARLKEFYRVEGKSKLKKILGCASDMQIPKLVKVVVTTSSEDVVVNSKLVDNLFNEIYAITGQKPVKVHAKKSIAAFKLREGVPMGVKVTLRGDMMYLFIDRLINIALPRARDFRGLSANQFDGRGNFSMGIKEQVIFPEIDYDKIDKVRGMNIIIVTTANNNNDAKELLEIFNFPFMN